MEKQIRTLAFILLLFAAKGYAQQPGINTDPNTKSKSGIELDINNINSVKNRKPTGTAQDFPKIGYDDYVIERDRYKADPKPREPYISYLAGCDSFYKFKAPVLVAAKLEDLKTKLAEDERTKARAPTLVPTLVKQQEQMVDYYSKFLMPGHPLLSQLADLKAKMEKLSGSSEEYAKKQKEDAIANKEFPKAASSNPAWEAAASSAVANMAGSGGEIKVLKSVTTTGTWAIKKTEQGVPIYRYQWVAVGYSQGGKCYIRMVDVRQTYAGGGTWNPGVSYLPAGLTDEIPCGKIH